MKKTFFSLLSAALVLLMILSFNPHAQADSYAYGWWDTVKVDGWTVGAWFLDEPVTKCSSMRIEFDASPKAGTSVKTWNVWAKTSSSSSSFKKIGTIYLPDGCGFTDTTIRIKPAQNIEAITVTPAVSGSFSYDFNMSIYDIVADGSSSRSNSAQIFNDDTEGGYWESIKINTSSGSYNVSAFMFDYPLRKVKEFSVEIEVEMKGNCSCKTWEVRKVTSNGSSSKIGTLYLPDGNGYGNTTIKFKNGQNLDGIAVIPTVSGGYSWELSLNVFDVQYY